MLFVPCSVGRQRNPLALASKKSIALQLRRQPSSGVAPISGGSGASVTVSSASEALPTVAPMTLAGWADAAQGAPLEVVEQLVIAEILLPTVGWMGLLPALMASTLAGAA